MANIFAGTRPVQAELLAQFRGKRFRFGESIFLVVCWCRRRYCLDRKLRYRRDTVLRGRLKHSFDPVLAFFLIICIAIDAMEYSHRAELFQPRIDFSAGGAKLGISSISKAKDRKSEMGQD